MQDATLAAIKAVCADLQHVAAAIRRDTDAVARDGDHVEIIKHYNHVRLAAELIKESREAIAQINDQLSREVVPERMKLASVKTITVEGVGRVTVSYRYSCTMLDKLDGIKWLKDEGHGGLVQETVNAQTLAAFAKNLLETEGKELPAELFKVSTSPYTSITKVK